MPLVILCGVPSSGKTTRTEELSKYLQDIKQKKCNIISENSMVEEPNATYAESKFEKIVRGRLKSEATRLIGKDDVTIIDGFNYIKGFRYELFCVSKQHKTPHCIIHCVTPIDTSWDWNLKRDLRFQYSKEIFDAIIQRFEYPDSRNRWDTPMFSILADGQLPCDEIYSSLFESKAPTPNQSTQLQPLSDNNFLFNLDKCTQEVVSALMKSQKFMVGDIKIAETDEELQLNRKVSLGEVSRLRRQFITYTKSHPVEDPRKIRNMFVQYLNTALNT